MFALSLPCPVLLRTCLSLLGFVFRDQLSCSSTSCKAVEVRFSAWLLLSPLGFVSECVELLPEYILSRLAFSLQRGRRLMESVTLNFKLLSLVIAVETEDFSCWCSMLALLESN